MKADCEPQLFYFKPDKSFSDNIRDDLAGIVKMRIYLGLQDILEDKSIGTWDRIVAKPAVRQGYLFANIYHVKNKQI